MKIITTVGTSLISNHPQVDCRNLENQKFSESLFDGADDSNTKKDITKKEAELLKCITDDNACAELASLKKINPAGNAEVYLLCTETVTSYMCGRVLQKYLVERVNVKLIKGLQVQNLDYFKKEGVHNLLSSIESVAQGGNYWDDVCLNVTGGYKGIIPIMSVIGQIKGLPTYYLFKGEDDRNYELIEIPRMPIDYQSDIFENYWDTFSQFGHKGDEILASNSLSHEFIERCGSCLEFADGMVMLNPVGRILWWNFQQQFFFIRTTDEVWAEIERQTDIKRILENKFCIAEIRLNKTERKQDHYVFDDGNNNNRIYYFEKNGEFFIYKTFQSEERARAYINEPFDEYKRIQFAQSAKPFHIKIQR